jgi:hypothetical protein
MDDQLNVRASGALRRRLEDAAKRQRRKVTALGRLIWQDWLAANDTDTEGRSVP